MINDYYTTEATVKSIVETINELGPDETSDVFTTAMNISCALETVNVDERFINGTNITFATHRIYCAITSTAITENNVIQIGSSVYDIKGVSNPMERGHHQEILVELRT